MHLQKTRLLHWRAFAEEAAGCRPHDGLAERRVLKGGVLDALAGFTLTKLLLQGKEFLAGTYFLLVPKDSHVLMQTFPLLPSQGCRCVVEKMNHGELLAASGEDPLDFSDFAEVFLQDGSVVEVVGDVLALDGCEL